jgi:hypothetical protein
MNKNYGETALHKRLVDLGDPTATGDAVDKNYVPPLCIMQIQAPPTF